MDDKSTGPTSSPSSPTLTFIIWFTFITLITLHATKLPCLTTLSNKDTMRIFTVPHRLTHPAVVGRDEPAPYGKVTLPGSGGDTCRKARKMGRFATTKSINTLLSLAYCTASLREAIRSARMLG